MYVCNCPLIWPARQGLGQDLSWYRQRLFSPPRSLTRPVDAAVCAAAVADTAVMTGPVTAVMSPPRGTAASVSASIPSTSTASLIDPVRDTVRSGITALIHPPSSITGPVRIRSLFTRDRTGFSER